MAAARLALVRLALVRWVVAEVSRLGVFQSVVGCLPEAPVESLEWG